MAPKSRSVEERFWENVKKTDSCWLWTGNKHPRGYGKIWTSKRKCEMTHRLSLKLHGKELPPWCVVMHTCDNPSCVNPDHLQIGTHKDNQIDKVVKGRQAKGEIQGHSSLSEIEVKAMRQLLKNGWKVSDIAAVLKRTYSSTYQAIHSGWKHVK